MRDLLITIKSSSGREVDDAYSQLQRTGLTRIINARIKCHDKHILEDLAQEALMHVHRNLQRYDVPDTDAECWAYLSNWVRKWHL